MCMVLCSIACAVMLVTIGYFVLYSAAQGNLSKSIAGFGKILAVVIFVLGGIVLISGIYMSVARRGMCCMGMGKPCMMGHHMGMNWGMPCPMMGENKEPGKKMEGMSGKACPAGSEIEINKAIDKYEKKKVEETIKK